MGYAVITRYHGPTNYRGSRVIATGPAAHLPAWDAAPGTRAPMTRATVGWDYGAGNSDAGTPYAGWGDADANHRRAADGVLAKLRAEGWTVYLAPDDRGASLPDDSGRVFTLRYGVAPEPDPWTIAPLGTLRGDPTPADILAAALTGPTAGATARRIAPAAADNLAAAGWTIGRAR